MRRGPSAVFAFLAYAATTTAAAQEEARGPTLSVTLQSREPRVQATGLLADGKYVALLRSGFPLRLYYRLGLWRVRANWFDQFVQEVSWDVVVRHDPLADDFVLIRTRGAVTRHPTVDELARALEIPYRVALTATGTGRFYFLCRLEVTTLNDTDLAELERWLRGEVGPAVSGSGSVGDALARGAQRVLVRLAGLPRVTLETRSPRFRPEP